MSRTLAHRPWAAWFDTPSNCVEEHCHVDGPCDLPPLDVWRRHLRASASAPWRCGWELDRDRLPNRCGCALCTGSVTRRMDRRADRQRARRQLRTGRWREEYGDG